MSEHKYYLMVNNRTVAEGVTCEYALIFTKAIKKMPKGIIADVEPVRHGRWIEQEKYTFGTMYDCSICDNRILDNGHSWNYCPNCGAKMDEKE